MNKLRHSRVNYRSKNTELLSIWRARSCPKAPTHLGNWALSVSNLSLCQLPWALWMSDNKWKEKEWKREKQKERKKKRRAIFGYPYLLTYPELQSTGDLWVQLRDENTRVAQSHRGGCGGNQLTNHQNFSDGVLVKHIPGPCCCFHLSYTGAIPETWGQAMLQSLSTRVNQ